MSEDLRNLPTHEQALKAISRLKSIKWPKFSNYESIEKYIKSIEKIIFEEFNIIPEGLRYLPTNNFEIPIFRARPLASINNIHNISEHGYPPIEYTNFQRCNFPKHPVLYCSNHPMTTLVEINRNYDLKGKEFCLTKWEIKPSSYEVCTQNFLHLNLNKNNPFFGIRDFDIKHLEKTFDFQTDSDKDKKKGLLELFKFIHEVFISDKNYKISAAIAHRALYAKHTYKSDIIIYPSVQTEYRGVNFAINPKFVDKHMILKRLYLIRAAKFDKTNDLLDVQFGGYGEVIDNSIIWKSIQENENEFLEYRLKDFDGIIE